MTALGSSSGFDMPAEDACAALKVSPQGLAALIGDGLLSAHVAVSFARAPQFATVRVRAVEVARLVDSDEVVRYRFPEAGMNTERPAAMGAIMRHLHL